MAKANNRLTITAGKWNSACDSYGKVQHSRKYDCVYSASETQQGTKLATIAARIPRGHDARLLAAAKELYVALKYMNHVENGYCICPLRDGMRPDKDHATGCADARKAIRKAESNHADTNSASAESEWMRDYPRTHVEAI